jgi:predicted metal-dependent peptidase
MTAQVRIEQARWWALSNEPFYGSLAMKLGDVLATSTKTAETDGKVIRWNPDYVESLTDPKVRWLLLHEALHCGHLHLWRLPPTVKGNEAGDYAINLILEGIDGIERPEGSLFDPQYADLSEEEILGRLPDDESGDSGGGGGGGGGDQQSDGAAAGGCPDGDTPGSGGAAPPGSFTAPAAEPDASAAQQSNAAAELRDDWENAVIQAAQAAQALGQGDIPADMQRLLERMRHQTVDWRREMADFVRDAMSTRNDWSRSARRHAWQPVIYPRRKADSLGTVIFARDTSGSINDAICAQFSALVTDCVAEQGCEGLVIDCDVKIQAEYTITDYEPCPLTAKGGGGTDFRPVFDRADELVASGQQIAGIVYLTDLDCNRYPESTDFATLWVATSDREPPFGRAVRIEVNL